MKFMNFLERCHVVHAFPSGIIAANEDIYNGDPASDVISMANAQSCVFLVIQNAGVTGSATIEVFACDDVTPTNTSAISFFYKRITAADTHGATTETKALRTTAGANQIYAIEVPAAKLAEVTAFTAKYIQCRLSEAVNNPVDGGVVAFLMGLRSAEDALGTQVT